MINYRSIRPKCTTAKLRKSMAVPDQSLSVIEIANRYIKGLPIDLVKRDPVFVEQSDHDLERLSRMDFAEKAEFADQMLSQAEAIKADYTDRERARLAKRETARKAKLESDAAKAAASTKLGSGV